MSSEQRQGQRKELRNNALMTMDDAAHIFVQTMDIGQFGMCLSGIREQLPSGRQGSVAFDIFFQGQVQNVKVRFRVAYCIPDGPSFKAGIQFLELESPGAQLIAQFVAE
jgi:hypothetical protein